MVGRPGLFSLIALLFVASLGVIYANLQPRYRLADQVPDKRQAVAASNRLDAKLTGAGVNPMSKAATVGFSATTTIKRSDFGLGYAAPAVGDEVKLKITAAFEK